VNDVSAVEWSYTGSASFVIAQYVSTYNQTAWYGTWWWISHCFPWGLFQHVYTVQHPSPASFSPTNWQR